jgi:transcriptional regulator GlxA family with amidase domain
MRNGAHVFSGTGDVVLPGNDKVKTIGIALFDGFALPEIACIMEAFQCANEFTQSRQGGSAQFNVCLLSTTGGRIASSSSVFVWTESIKAPRHPDRFHALFVAGGADVNHAGRNEEMLAWLRRICLFTEHVFPVGDGWLLLDMAGCRRNSVGDIVGDKNSYRAEEDRNAPSALRQALLLIEQELGSHLTRKITNVVSLPASALFTDTIRRNAAHPVSERIQASADWLEQNGHRQVGIDEAARVAAMSERNFLRRFKAELGVTPSDYLLYIRLDMSCRLLVETTLPVDKIARRCGIGSGGTLSKLFRKHLGKTPTDYRTDHRQIFQSS